MNFNKKVYNLTKRIPKGKVSTYKEIGNALNSKAYRAIGNALRNNKDPINIPCYKIVKNTGEVGGYSGKIKGPKISQKVKLLENDGIPIKNGYVDNFHEYLYKFTKNESIQ